MSSDQTIIASDVLDAVMLLRRRGAGPIVEELEKQEPDLVEYLLEELSAIHQRLSALIIKPKDLRRVHHRIEGLAVTLIVAQRQAHVRLWRTDATDTPLAQLDPSLNSDPPCQPNPDPGEGPGDV